MIACVLAAAPKFSPPAGMPPMTPGSAVIVIRSMTFSSLATLARPSGMPMPRLTTLLGISSSAARRAMILRVAHRHRRDRAHLHPDLAGERRAVGLGERLPVILGTGDDDAVDQDARDLDLARVEAAPLGDALDLDDDDAAGVVRGGGDGEHLQREGLLLHRDVAVGIGGRAADDPDIDRERLVEQVVGAADRHQLDDVLGGARVELAAAEARVDEGAQPDARELARLVRGDVAVELRDHALRQVVGLDQVGDGQPLQLRHQTPVTADDAPDEPFVTEMVQALVLAVALAGGIDEGEIARAADGRCVLRVAGQEPLLERDGDFLGEADADEPAGRDRVAVADQPHGVRRRHDLAALGVLECAQQGMGRIRHGALPLLVRGQYRPVR